MSDLGKRLRRLIAQEEGVPSRAVNPAFVHKRRQSRVYPRGGFTFVGSRGGWIPPTQDVPGDRELQETRDKADRFLEQFGPSPKPS